MTTPTTPTDRVAAVDGGPLPVPFTTGVSMFLRLLAVQGSWNYETLLGNGIAFCVEPALRHLPGGRGGDAYRAALVREGQYFNAHPYLAAIAVGALARAELDGEPAARIERFRTALGSPLGSVGDRLVWASWLPVCSLATLAYFGLGGRPASAVALFLGLYNAGHLGLRAWGLHIGLRRGLRVGSALGAAIFRRGPQHLGQAGAVLAGIALPLVTGKIIGSGRIVLGAVLVASAVGGLALARLHGRVEAWKLGLGALAAVVLYSVVR